MIVVFHRCGLLIISNMEFLFFLGNQLVYFVSPNSKIHLSNHHHHHLIKISRSSAPSATTKTLSHLLVWVRWGFWLDCVLFNSTGHGDGWLLLHVGEWQQRCTWEGEDWRWHRQERIGGEGAWCSVRSGGGEAEEGEREEGVGLVGREGGRWRGGEVEVGRGRGDRNWEGEVGMNAVWGWRCWERRASSRIGDKQVSLNRTRVARTMEGQTSRKEQPKWGRCKGSQCLKSRPEGWL